MFTGLIQDVGCIVSRTPHANALSMVLSTSLPESRFELGASVACNGVCLTVTSFRPSFTVPGGTDFSVDIGPESLLLSRFGHLKEGEFVNLEPALRVGDALGGHDLTGHVDTLCEVRELTPQGNGFWCLRLAIAKEFSRWLIPKGSVAIAGVSLTLAHLKLPTADNGLESGEIEIMLVPHTLQNTTLGRLSAGQWVEVEFDRTVKAIATVLESMLPVWLSKLSSK